MTEEHNIYHLPPYNPLAGATSITHLYPQIITLNTGTAPAPSMTISIREYNDLLSQFLDRGKEIEHLQAVVKNVQHYLAAKEDVQGSLSAVEDALLLECERAMEGKE